MKTIRAIAMALLSLCLTAAAFGQSSNARLSGTVSDATGAVLPGVEITATNNATGVVTTVLSNEAGAYNFASLLPGVYTVSGSLPAFQTQTFREVQLGNAAQVRLNIALQVGAVATAVEVNVAADQILLESSSSVGEVLEQREVVNLPLVSNNVLDLVQVMAGVRMTNNPIFGANDTQFAGVAASNINVQRDGVPVTGSRWPTGLDTTTEMNPDLVGEVKMVLAPVDAEMGRGSGQVQIQTRSGTNEFHGGVVWNARNTKLDANTWSNNRSAVTAPWRNYPELTASIGGPIIRNKTHFFALYDQAWARTRTAYNASVLTPCAQRGIFRYYDNWNSAVGTAAVPTSVQPTLAAGATPTTPVVNAAGDPIAPATNPNGTPHNGILRYASIYGPLLRTPTQPDCSDAQVQTGRPWDPFRTQKDTTGYVDTLFKFMPAVNNYDIGDGLNTVGHRWMRGLNGADNLFGIGEPVQKKQYNGKVDHIFNQSHKISSSYSYEKTSASDTFRTWPGTFEGEVLTAPQVLTVNFTSTLSPTLVNEGRFGMSRMGTNVFATLYNPKVRDEILTLMPKSGSTTFIPLLGAGQVNFQVDQIVGTRGFTPQPILRDNTPRFTYADTASLTVGKHAFRFGGEYRHASSKSIVSSVGPANFPECGQFNGFNGDPTTPIAYGGAAPLAPVTGINAANIPGLAGNPFAGNAQRMENLLMFLSGSLCGVAQFRYINRPDQAQKEWNDPSKDPFKIRDFHQNEFGAFFKDDWKVSNSVTLNLGLRWDYYGPPYEKNGLSATLKGGGAGLFGMSGRDFGGWMSPGRRTDDSELIFIGPNSPNPSISPYPKDRNNFGPAVGFAWNATARTTIRGGYQIQYIGGGDFNGIENRLGNPPGSIFSARYTGDSSNPFLDMRSLTSGRVPLPIAPPVLPVQPIPITNRQTGIQAYDPNFINPYIQNLTLSVTRNVRSNLTIDARYIGTLTRKNFNAINLNEPNFLTNGLFQAFEAARNGGESALLNQMFNGINIAGAGFGPVNGPPVNGVAQTGALHLRSALASNLRGNLAMGNYSALATSLSTLNYSTRNPGNASLPFVPFGVNGSVLRHNGFPENFITTSPQFSAATYQTNGAHSNYHSLQLQSTLRPTYGLTVQGSYTWSKNLGVGTGGFTDPRNQAPDYTLLSTHRTHVFQSYGTFDLPVGPGQRLAANASGILARVIEGWQTSWIVNLSSGLPITMNAANMLYGRGTPDQVRPFDFKAARGVRWPDGAAAGNYFGNQFTKVTDPQCRAIAASLQPFCTLFAVADTSGNIILQNARPGTRGNVGLQTIEGAGVWTADMAIAKIFRINETFRGQIRMDAKNVFNHPTPGAPGAGFGAAPNDGGAQLNLNDTNPFGNMPNKGASVPQFPASRQFQLKVRLDF